MIRDPALRFWVDYVEAEGGLCEHDDETAQLLLPPALQRALGLPEAMTATSDPDVAQDAGAVLFAVGHPVLDAAAARVLTRGDVGRAYLAWPHSALPSRATLLAHARAGIAVDHGRIDPVRDPVPVYYPVLRVGVLVTYTLDDRFQECEEVWIDGCSAHVVAGAVVRVVQSQAALAQADAGAPLVAPALARAVAAAHAALDRRASVRAAALERQARLGLGDEQARAQGYYDAVLATLEQRRAAASPERRQLLDAQAEATQLERRRRLREIAAKSSPHARSRRIGSIFCSSRRSRSPLRCAAASGAIRSACTGSSPRLALRRCGALRAIRPSRSSPAERSSAAGNAWRVRNALPMPPNT